MLSKDRAVFDPSDLHVSFPYLIAETHASWWVILSDHRNLRGFSARETPWTRSCDADCQRQQLAYA